MERNRETSKQATTKGAAPRVERQLGGQRAAQAETARESKGNRDKDTVIVWVFIKPLLI